MLRPRRGVRTGCPEYHPKCRLRLCGVITSGIKRAARAASPHRRRRWPALAGVAIATVFRHFPTKAALLQAVLVRRFDRLREQAEALLDTTDPGTAFFDFFRHLVADAATKIAIAGALLDAGGDSDGEAAQASNGLRRAIGALLQHAQQAGAVRDDVELPEVYALLAVGCR
jgi:AcrR family transcriptional regulator